MASELEVPKRKRSRPSDWWAVNPSTPQQAASPPKNLIKAPKINHPEGLTQEAPTAGNRGKDAKPRRALNNKEADAEEDELVKHSREERPSQSKQELRRAAASSKTDNSKKSKKLRRGGASGVEEEGDIHQSTLKKRGRPAGSEREQERKDSESSSRTTAKKRKRPPNTETEEPNIIQSPLEEPQESNLGSSFIIEAKSQDPVTSKSKRGRPRHADTVIEGTPNNHGKSRTTRIKDARGRNSAKEAPSRNHRVQQSYSRRPKDNPEGKDGDEDESRGRRHARQDVATVEQELSTTSETREVNETGKKRKRTLGQPQRDEESKKGRKRTRKSNTESSIISTATETTNGNAAHNQELSTVEIETASSKLTKSRPGVKTASKATLARKKPKGANTSSSSENHPQVKPTTISKGSNSGTTGKVRGKRLSRSVLAENSEASSAEDEPPYQHLAEVTRKVTRQMIEAKWEPLPPNCVSHISQILEDIQRPVVARLNDERKRTQASTALQMVSRRLVSKISKGLPFPQRTRLHREDDFDFENILDHNRSLEAQLTPVIHANELLELELKKELHWLETEKEKLVELEANAKTETVVRNEAARKEHQILQFQDPMLDLEGIKEDIGLNPNEDHQSLQVATALKDEGLSLLFKEVGGHVESIQSNLKQVQGIATAIAKTKAVVQSTLYEHLDNAQYEEVVLAMD